jgi:hypothetical protein
MKQKNIEALPRLDSENFEGIFNVHREDNGMYYYNLLNTIVFPKNLPSTLFTYYTWEDQDTWPLVSYKNYKTPNLWWIILLANDISNPLETFPTGNTLLIPSTEVVKQILSQIS